MTTWAEGTVVANGIRIHYWRGPGRGRALVLQHGFGSNARCWHRVGRELAGEWDVIMPDARGHGLTEAPPDGYNPSVMSADLAAFCAALELDAPIVLGHSMGGSMVTALAAEHPGVAGAIIPVDPAWFDELPLSPSERNEALERRAMTREQLLALLDEIHPTWCAEDRDAWAESRQQISVEAATQVLAGIGRDWRADVRRFGCPALLVTADVALGGIVTPDVAAEAQRLNPLVQVAHIADSGHDVYRDQFEAFVAAVRSFARSL